MKFTFTSAIIMRILEGGMNIAQAEELFHSGYEAVHVTRWSGPRAVVSGRGCRWSWL